MVYLDDSIAEFVDHKDSVFAIRVVPDGTDKVFISGDCDDKCLIWRMENEKDG